MRHVPGANPKLKKLFDHLRGQPDHTEAEHWLDLIRNALFIQEQHSGGMPGWFNGHDSENVEIFQATFDAESHHLIETLMPGVRHAVWNPNGVRFFSSPTEHVERRFYGVATLASTRDVYVGYDHNVSQVLAYHTVGDRQKV